MTSTVFVDKQTVIEAPWLNDVNAHVYGPFATPPTSTATGGQTLVAVPPYTLGGYLAVFRNGLLQQPGVDYAETNTTAITFAAPGLSAGDVILVRTFSYTP